MSLPESVFRFAGELVDVAPEHTEWTGAIERVLRPLAPTLLVRDDYLEDFTAVVDRLHLGVRLVYESIPAQSPRPRPAASSRSLVNRVRLADGIDEALASWLAERLADRYDYDCVDDTRQLRTVDRGVTRAGQVKHGSRRFEKDDRFAVGDRTAWMLGSDNTGKIDDLLAERARRDAELGAANDSIVWVESGRRLADQRATVLKSLDDIPWSELDQAAASARVAADRESLERLRIGNTELVHAQQIAEKAAEAQESRDAELRAANAHLDSILNSVTDVDRHIGELADREPFWAIDTTAEAGLGDRFRAVARSGSREQIFVSAGAVQKSLTMERKSADDTMHRASRVFEALAVEFRRTWPTLAADLTESITDRGGYDAILDRIVAEGLPEYEDRFFTLLKQQSQQLTGQLHAEIRDAPRQVRARIEPVNQSLRRSPFDEGRFLQIRVRPKQGDELKNFMTDLQLISAGTWEDEDKVSAEQRFARLQSVMKRLGSTDDRAWRQRCLDTREHVSFVGIEEDAQGNEVNRHDSGAGLSGGQRQKLVIFCLAAALRYQLADSEDPVPAFGSIVLDEAFDKADSDFTRMAMDVFVEFGFHMILATPLKLLQTLEGYVGGVTYVSARDHNDSRTGSVAFEDGPE